jgi:hypothetical protein
MAIGRILRAENAEAIIQYNSDAICYSACVLVLAGATSRFIGGKVGIHRPYLEVPGGQVSPNKVRDVLLKTLQDMRAYFRKMNVSEQLADDMLRVNPEKMHLLSVAEADHYGLTAEDPITQEVSDLEEAQRYRVSRQEYARRKNLAGRRCANLYDIHHDIHLYLDCYENIMTTGR